MSNVVSAKMNRSQFLNYVSRQYGIPLPELRETYDAIVNSIVSLTGSGYSLSLTGLGVFCVKQHRGHPVQFMKENGQVSDYSVLKFSASDLVNQKLRDMREQT